MSESSLDLPLCRPTLLPLGNHIKIHLEPVDVVLVSDKSIQNTVKSSQVKSSQETFIRHV